MRLWKIILAYFRLSPSAVCEMSAGRALYDDFHDFSDSGIGPVHFHRHTCMRCGKEFVI